MKVLCFGSLNIDYTYRVDHFVRPGETLSARSLQVFPGGKGLNQSLALAKAGAKVSHAGAVGEDGRFLLELLENAGVDISQTEILPDTRTGNAIIQNDAAGDNCILLFGGANRAITPEQVDRTLASCEPGDYLLLQNEISSLGYLVEQAAKKGLRIVLNPSPMNGEILALPLDQIDLFLLNEVEAAQLTGLPSEEAEALGDALRERFPKAGIVLTLGSRGSVYLDGEKRIVQKPYPVQAVDTTAAGDTFTGYFLAGLLAGRPIEETMDRASRASAIAVTRPGAATSIPTPDEVDGWSR